MIWKHWHWLDDAVMPLTLALLRVTALWLWLPLLERWFIPAYYEAAEVPLLPIWLMLALLLGGTVTTHLSLDLIHSLPQARRVVAVVGVAALFLALWLRFYRDLYPLWDIAWLRTWGRELIRWQGQLPPAYLALPLMAYLWLRGILDGSRRLEHQDVVNAFGLGTTGLVCLLLLAALDQSPLPPATGSVLFLFFATAMAGLSLAGLKKARLPSRSDGVVEGLRLNRYWLGSAASVIILILGIGFLLSLILAPNVVLDILRWSWIILSQVLILAIKLVSLVLYPILLLLSYIVTPLTRAFGGFQYEPATPAAGAPAFDPNQPLGDLPQVIAQMPEALRWLILLIGIVGLGFIFALVLRRLLQPDDDNTWDESRDSIFSTELLLAQLAKLVHSPGEIGNAKTFNPFLSLHNETAPRRIIRQLYQQLLADANRLNQPRRPAQTPSEYSRTLADRLPESREPLAQLTEQYLQARYAAEPPGTTQVETAQRAWVQLSISLNKAAQDPADRAT